MVRGAPTKVAYLFGAGATHAEFIEIEPRVTSDDRVERNLGLLMSKVSARVMAEARLSAEFLKDMHFLEGPLKPKSAERATGVPGAMNIELLISLIENAKIRRWDQKTHALICGGGHRRGRRIRW